MAAMGERPRQQRRIAKGIAKPLFEIGHFRVDVSKSNNRLTLANSGTVFE
jgi:hypothetical protein